MTLTRLGFGPAEPFGSLTGFVKQNGLARRVVLVCHPLWQMDHPLYAEAQTAASTRYQAAELKPLNPFLLLRRPAEYT